MRGLVASRYAVQRSRQPYARLPERFCNHRLLAADTCTGKRKQRTLRKHVRRARHFWRVITPRRTVLQYAGGIGLVSAGVGWMYGPRKVWETDFLIGFVPSYNTGGTKVTLTLKQTYAPFNVQINKLFSYQPLACGLYLNSIFGEEFWTSEPKRYPEHYYGFSTGIRAGINLGQRIKLNIPPMRRRWCREIIFYYEANTCDLYLVSFFKNKDVSFWDILNFSFGLKFTVF